MQLRAVQNINSGGQHSCSYNVGNKLMDGLSPVMENSSLLLLQLLTEAGQTSSTDNATSATTLRDELQAAVLAHNGTRHLGLPAQTVITASYVLGV
ncbi:hypothetical protein B566_EDAN005461, partial [Ephemera danica]